MKLKKIKILIALVAVATSGCTTSNEHGSCIGLNDKPDPKLEYKYSAWNIGIAILGFSLVLPPLFVVLDELQCPAGKK